MEAPDELRLRVGVGLGRLGSRVRDGQAGRQERDGNGKFGGFRLVARVEGWLRHRNVGADAGQPRLLLDAVFGERSRVGMDAHRNALEAGHRFGRVAFVGKDAWSLE